MQNTICIYCYCEPQLRCDCVFSSILKEEIMQDLPMLLLMLASLSGPAAMATEAKVDITLPADGAKLDAKAQNKIVYDVTLGGEGDHIHVYVDGKQVALLRQMKG